MAEPQMSDGFEPSSTLTCPQCGHRSKDLMPTDACQYFYDCKGCGALLKPLPGDCCVYCSFVIAAAGNGRSEVGFGAHQLETDEPKLAAISESQARPKDERFFSARFNQ